MWGAEGRASRAAAVLTLIAVLFLWNAEFDRGIDAGAKRYLALQQARAEGGGPFVSMQEVMRQASAASAMRATASSAPIGVAGAAAVWWLNRRARRRRRPR